jgi:hypothetical protein
MSTSPAPPRRRPKLTGFEHRFVKAFPELLAADPASAIRESAKVAGYQGDDTTLQRTGLRILRRPRVLRALDRRMGTRVMGQREVLAELTVLGSTPWDNLDPVSKGVKFKCLDALMRHYGGYRDPMTVLLERALRAILQQQAQVAQRAIAAQSGVQGTIQAEAQVIEDAPARARELLGPRMGRPRKALPAADATDVAPVGSPQVEPLDRA